MCTFFRSAQHSANRLDLPLSLQPNRQTSKIGLAFLVCTAIITAYNDATFADAEEELAAARFAEGVKIGEVTPDSAVMWTRLCSADRCDASFQLPGVKGEVRVLYRSTGKPWTKTAWQSVSPADDYTYQALLEGLTPGTTCEYRVEARNARGQSSIQGSFRTAPPIDSRQTVRFVVTTGHKHKTSDDPALGPNIYPAMAELEPHFFVHTGDVVYYDHDTPPIANTIALARLHWHRLYSLPRRVSFHQSVPSYFIKDDHDLLKNDCWPGQTFGELTFAQGVQLFREQTPTSGPPYRTFRWGKHLQIWLVEGREYRSPNFAPDGPDKSIWGLEQMRWLQESMAASNATFRLLITPTPIVGPDRKNKRDNHCNKNFQHEGEQVRRFLSGLTNTHIVCGDRHWQYVSVDPKTGLREYSCGPSTDKHAGGWNQQDVRPEHRFLRVKGGFLSVNVSDDEEPTIVFSLHDVNGRVVHADTRMAE